MSGFFGVIRRDRASIQGDLLEKISNHLSRRGPDGSNIWQRGEMSGCFALMKTDRVRQAAQQPVTLDNRYRLLGDIRLDGRPELIEQLTQAGEHPESATTDEALVLHAWRCWGRASLQRLLGDFSFALWDADQKHLWAARDFIGARPFFYAQFPGGFCFSNTFQALRTVSELSRELDDVFMGDFLLEGWCSDPTRTVYRDIHRLTPGHLLYFSDNRVETDRFLTLPIEEPLRLATPGECLETYRHLLDRVVEDRLPDGPAALSLSGGLDSGTVCSVASDLSKRCGDPALKAFTVSWHPLLVDDEPDFARLTASHLGLPHEVLDHPVIVPWDGEPATDESVRELTFNPFAAKARKDYLAMAAHSRIVLSGDGGDDVLTGQAWPYLSYLWKRREWSTIARTFGGFFLSHGQLPPPRAGFRSRVRRFLRNDDFSVGYPEWLSEDFEKRAGLRQRWHDLWRDPDYQHPVHPQAYASLHSTHWAGVLEDEDAGATGALLEVRAPLLDLRLLKFLLRLSPVPWCVDKFLLRETMKTRLPSQVLQRPKTPLPGNPLDAALQKKSWRPVLPVHPPDRIHQFVNWMKWRTTLENAEGSLATANLRPFSLLLWLKAIENE